MGMTLSRSRLVHNVTDYVIGKKRKYSEFEDDEVNKVIDIALQTPKRKKLLSTAQYIYQALFEEGKNSDVTVWALGEEFLLHKVYLCQSPYFASMFGGSWLETTKNYITIEVVDPLINIDSLRMVFGSLYNSEITLNPLEIVPILATATMFQLDGLIEKCTEVMLETINPKTALSYYNAACQYGDKKLKEVCFNWFLVNLMTYYFSHPLKELHSIPVSLMTKLVSHPKLFVIQTEYSLYILLKYWMYLLVHDDSVCGEEAPSSKQMDAFYISRKDDIPYLLCEEGAPFASVFEGLRLQYLMLHQSDLEIILKDNILPRTWLNPILLQQWKKVLRVYQNCDKGPTHISEKEFLNTCLRCGRTLQVNERLMWRWTGFHFGMDLIMITDGLVLSVKRYHRSDMEQLLSFQTTRNVAVRITAVKLNEQRQIVYLKQTDIQSLTLAKNEEIQVMSFDKDITYPLIISANILYTSIENLDTDQEAIVQTVS